ncbi:hypothetical protein Cantr_06937 [Candida viswanathii]|uniref:Uncharacterized protein n=1 Tax=Candida viswanathii TaxID=5486 RepID=A0A367XZ52_9ASCO|nr:hypothetical protein Cantr_06937 [Candida viswanathii]
MSADYHAKMSESLFNHYSNLVAVKDNDNPNSATNNALTASTSSTATSDTTINPAFNANNYHHPHLNQAAGMMTLLTPNIQEYKTHGLYQEQEEDDFGYFSSRAALSVPSSRIDPPTNTFDQQLNRFIIKQEPAYLNEQYEQQQLQQQLDENYQVPPPSNDLLPQQLPPQQQNLQHHHQQPQQVVPPPPPQQQQHIHHQPAPAPAQPQQNYMANQNFMPPPARPPPQRQNTAPVYSLSVKNLQQQQQLQQDSTPTSRHMNPPQGYLHQRGESFSHDPRPKIKKGTRPKKKPGFHLKLDGLRKVSGPTITSSQSDSGTDYWNRTPGGYAKLNLSYTPAIGTEQRHDLRISEQDLDVNDSNFGVPSFNLTPSVDPPANTQSGYFELTNKTTNTNQHNVTPGVNHLGVTAGGGFFSPAINENAVNYFNQTFEEYLQDAEKFDFQQDTLDTNFTDLNIPDDPNLFGPLSFDNSLSNEFLSPDNETIDSQTRSFSNDMTASQYYNSNISGGDEDSQDQSQQQLDARLALPTLQKTLSNQSGHSVVSFGSELTRSTSTNPNAAATPPTTTTTTGGGR